MKALILADPHLADRPPSIRTETYTEDILAKIEFTVEVARERADCVVYAGDVLHVKAPTRTSHALVQRMAKLVKAYGVPVFIVPGNHDMQNDRLESLDRQPLGVLFEAGALPLIGQADYAVNYLLFGVPWLGDWTADLSGYMEQWRESDAGLMVAHAPLVKPGETRPYDFVDAEDWAFQMEEGDCYFGHMHDPDGVFEAKTPNGPAVLFCNQGALSRGSIHEATLRRKPAVTLYDTSKQGTERFERIEVPHRPPDEVYRLAEKQVEADKADRLDEFLTGVEHTELEGLSIEAVLAHVEGLGLEPDVLREIKECLEVAGA